jgi:CO/xanthine dehydrogenase Mo-binding subunit
MLAAEAFGVSVDKVRVQNGDTATAPYAGGAGGSKITYSVGPAVVQAAAEARRQLLELASGELEVPAAELEISDGEVRPRGHDQPRMPLGEVAAMGMRFGSSHPPIEGQARVAVPSASPMFTVHIARVRVDRETGLVSVTGYAAIQDVGRALNPPEIEGQIHGGATQGLGRALGEELVYDADGQLRTGTFVDYQMPSADQVPEIAVQLVEVPSALGPYGARGVGEPPAVPPAAAVANAVAAATGVRLNELPLPASKLVTQPEPVLTH